MNFAPQENRDSTAARTRDRARSGGFAGEQRVELARAVERDEVVVAADVTLTDVDLRYGAPAGAAHHLGALRGLLVDADLRDLADPLGAQQPLGVDAVRAIPGCVHRDRRLHQASL